LELPDDYSIKVLSKGDTVKDFDCFNPSSYIEIEKRRLKIIRRLDQDMTLFLARGDALKEQESSLNTTSLLLYNDKAVGYVSLCADSLQLKSKFSSQITPALKVARLAIDKNFQNKGLAKLLINYAVYKALIMRIEFCGVKFLTLDCFRHRLSYYTDNIGFKKNDYQGNQGDMDLPFSLSLDIDEYIESSPM
jgi:GNAT superfamily N-acetyltransferase